MKYINKLNNNRTAEILNYNTIAFTPTVLYMPEGFILPMSSMVREQWELILKLDNIKGCKVAIHCKTNEEIAEVLNICNAVINISWDTYKEDTCISLFSLNEKNNNLLNNSVHYLKQNGYIIIPASNFINANKIETNSKIESYQILEFINSKEEICYLNNFNTYIHNVNNSIESYSERFSLKEMLNNESFKISKIKYKDFLYSLNTKILNSFYSNSTIQTISSFEIENNILYFKTNNQYKYSFEYLNPYIEPSFSIITYDGVTISNPDQFVYILNKIDTINWSSMLKTIEKDYTTNNKYHLYFSTLKALEKHKNTTISLKELKTLDINTDNSSNELYKIDINKLHNLIKEKQNEN